MKLVRTAHEARAEIREVRRAGLTVGLVPTMGYLHHGHLSLVDLASREAGFTTVSVFVNPAQFGPQEDFKRYPRDLERDRRLLEERGADLLFAPASQEMYPEEPLIRFEIRRLTEHLCGARRPGHFPGVLLVVAKLFNILQPDLAVFGQKDLQQLILIRRMVRDLDFPIRILAAPTAREPDGLAMSSRNAYLSSEERREAPVLFRALCRAKALVEAGERRAAEVIRAVRGMILQAQHARIDYVEIVDLERLKPLERLEGRFAIALAVHFGEARLIDNLVLSVEDGRVEEVTALG